MTSYDEVDDAVEDAIVELDGVRREHAACAAADARAKTEAAHAAAALDAAARQIELRDADIRTLRTRVGELESEAAAPPPRRRFAVPRLSFGAERLALVGGAFLLFVVAVAAWVAYARAHSRPAAVDPRSLDAEQLEEARVASAPDLGSVRAVGYAYDRTNDSYVADFEITPSSAKGVSFVAVSATYSSLAIDGSVLRTDPRARVLGAEDLDRMITAFGKRQSSIGEIRRVIARSPQYQWAPGRTYRVRLTFKSPEALEVEPGTWGRATFLVWTSATLAKMRPGLRLGKDILDAAYTLDWKTTDDLDQVVKIEVAVPNVSMDESDDGDVSAAPHHEPAGRAAR